MAKKNSLNLLYLIGMAAVVIGSFLPVIRISFGPFGKIDFTIVKAFQNLGSLDSWLALLMFLTAAAGIVLCLVNVSNGTTLKTVCLLASIVLGLVFFTRGNFFKEWFNITGFGFYVIFAGWVVALIGNFIKK